MVDQMMQWPFFDDGHRQFHGALSEWTQNHFQERVHQGNIDDTCRQYVAQLGEAGWLRYCVPAIGGGVLPALDSRSICIARQTLGYHDGLADFAFAMQGLGLSLIHI